MRPPVQEQHPAGNGAGELHLVGHNDHGLALPGQVQHDVQHLAHHFGVQRRCHLIKEQDLRMHTQRPHDGYPLFLSAGKLPGVALCLLQQADPVQQGFCFLLHLGPGGRFCTLVGASRMLSSTVRWGNSS